MKTKSSHSEPPSGFPSSTRISEPTKTLLVVDDDQVVRQAEAEILCQQGYTVLQAESAAQALRLAREAAAIHLLITDFSMPEVDGLELTRQFRAVHPKTPVLMLSGSLRFLRDGTQDLDRFEFLAKPFQLDELLHKVRALLDVVAPFPIRKPWCCD
ncbi:MAG: response regulator [Verrucomicrobiota bacterium]|jgi:DNA-binding response OmpR family regulator